MADNGILRRYLNDIHSERDEWHEPEPGKYHASSVGKCLRNRYFKRIDDTQPGPSAYPHFELGHRLEDLYLESLKHEYGDRYVKTDIPVEIQLEECSIVGETDPVVVDNNCVPQRVFEVKTTTNLKYTRHEPKWTHLTQLHCYMKALDLDESSIVYIQKTDLSTVTHNLEFDPDVWEVIAKSTETLHEAIQAGEPPEKQPEEARDHFCDHGDKCCKNI